jgi:hypothetical protein
VRVKRGSQEELRESGVHGNDEYLIGCNRFKKGLG